MLIKCPRCGFSQPEDQYCASCGVNIETYVPRKTSLFQKIFSSTLVQVFVVIALTLGVSYYALKAKDSNSPQNSRRKTMPPTSAANMASNANPSQAKNATSSDADLANNQEPPAVSVELQNEQQKDRLTGGGGAQTISATSSRSSALTKTLEAAAPAGSTTTAAAVAAKSPSARVKFSYYEVNRTILSYWIQNSGNPADESVANFGSISQDLFQKQILYSPLKTETTDAALNVKTNFQSGLSKDNNFIGFNAEVSLNTISEEQILGTLVLSKTTLQGSDFTRAAMNLRSGYVFFLHWKNDMMGLQNETGISEIPPFQILRSKQFLDQKTELVIIVEIIR